jgi:hypothetical protein
MTSDLLVFLRGKDAYLAPRCGTTVALVLEDDTGLIEPAANRAAHLSVVFSDAAGPRFQSQEANDIFKASDPNPDSASR